MSGVSVKISGGKAWKKSLAPYLDSEKTSVNVGILEGAKYPDGLPVATVAAVHEFGTEHVPARSFMRSTLGKQGNAWAKAVAGYLKSNPNKIQAAFALAGKIASKDMQAAIEEGIAPALKQETIEAKTRRKGSKGNPDLALVDTGAMQKAISYEVKS